MAQSDSAAERTVHTHCLICEQLCGLNVTVREGRVLGIRPDKQNPYTWRDFCIKGQRAGDVAASPWRITSPMRRVGDRFEPASYDDAIADISTRLRATIDRHGANAVAGYSGNPFGFSFGAMLWHASFLSALGTHQQFSVQSIDSNAKHVASDLMFGVEMLALVPDIDDTDFVMLIGTNPAVSKFNWGGKVPNGWRRLKDRVRDGAQLVVIDPRRTETAAAATHHLAPLPETDWALLLAMIKVILDERLETLPHGVAVTGLDRLRALARTVTLEALAQRCDVAVDEITAVARAFAAAPRAFAFAGTGPALGARGTLTHWLTLVLNVLTDRLEQPGGRFMPNWPTPWQKRPAAGSKGIAVRSRVRDLKPVVGNHSLAELADEILVPGEGQVRALIMGGGNPVSTGPDGQRLAQALSGLDLLVSVDLFQRESHAQADWLIPGLHFLEREEIHVPLHAYNDRPFVQTTRKAVEPPGGIRPEWTFYRDLAAALGFPLFGGAPMTPNMMAGAMLAGGGMVALSDVQAAEHGLIYGTRSMGHLWDMLRAHQRPLALCPDDLAEQLQRALDAQPDGSADALRIISRRRNGMMNASLTETSGSAAPDETADSVEINRADALARGIPEGARVELRNAQGAITVTARLSDDIRRGTLVVAHGWGSALFDPATGREVFRVGNARNRLVSNSDLDALSGVPRMNGTLVDMAPAL